jgi:hypothetical protein
MMSGNFYGRLDRESLSAGKEIPASQRLPFSASIFS